MKFRFAVVTDPKSSTLSNKLFKRVSFSTIKYASEDVLRTFPPNEQSNWKTFGEFVSYPKFHRAEIIIVDSDEREIGGQMRALKNSFILYNVYDNVDDAILYSKKLIGK